MGRTEEEFVNMNKRDNEMWDKRKMKTRDKGEKNKGTQIKEGVRHDI